MPQIWLLLFAAVSIVQAAAIFVGLGAWAGLPAPVALVMAAGMAVIPFVGASISIIAAADLWRWGVVDALVVFGSAQLGLVTFLMLILRRPLQRA
ncbi:MAG: hypothetical protein AAFX81_11445 [Pseudomonadota bacterium]